VGASIGNQVSPSPFSRWSVVQEQDPGEEALNLTVTCMRDNTKSAKKRKCLYHPAMDCPTPNEPCIFVLIEKMNKEGHNRIP
jgi:hypothetical protein